MAKRTLDLLVSLSALVVLSPFLLLIALAIVIDSGFPILFRQRRIGINNREFTIYKFRTMRVGTPNVATDQLSNPEAFITKTGRLLRKSSLDELPQLFNIVLGDMSLVGPRPALYNQYNLIELRTRHAVHLVRPGLTGWAQINGRDEVTDEDKVNLDLYYCQHHSLKLDLWILLRTFGAVAKARGIRA